MEVGEERKEMEERDFGGHRKGEGGEGRQRIQFRWREERGGDKKWDSIETLILQSRASSAKIDINVREIKVVLMRFLQIIADAKKNKK